VVVVTGSSRSALIATRASRELKDRFVALANARSMTESALLTLLIETVLSQNAAGMSPHVGSHEHGGSASHRLTLRLRAEDIRLLAQRAAARRMKPATYLVALLRAHLRKSPPLPIAELNDLKASVARLSSIDRLLQRLLMSVDGVQDRNALITAACQQTSADAREVRRLVVEVVQRNQMSWEAADG
jgi:hypothetical protein